MEQISGKVCAADTNIFHCLAATEENLLYGWGQNKDVQLGSIKSRTQIKPIQIPHSINEKIIKIRCGMKHNLLLTEAGNIYSFGDNTNNQLGNQFFQLSKYQTPQLISSLSGEEIDDIISSSFHNFAISRTFFFIFFSIY